MKIFAKNAVVAKTRFFKMTKMLKKLKKTAGEIVSVTKVGSREPWPGGTPERRLRDAPSRFRRTPRWL